MPVQIYPQSQQQSGWDKTLAAFSCWLPRTTPKGGKAGVVHFQSAWVHTEELKGTGGTFMTLHPHVHKAPHPPSSPLPTRVGR